MTVFANLHDRFCEYEREYQLLKERARKGLEEVGKGAKSDNKHYRPWEDEAKAVKSEVVESEESPTTFPDNYHGHPFSEIISKYWELNNHGYEPTIGDRDTKTYQLANQLFMLPNVYTLNDLRNVRLKCGMKEEGADVQNRQWLSRGFVTVVTDKKDTYKKLKYLSA